MTLTERFLETRQWSPARKTAYVSAILLPGPLFAWVGARAHHALGSETVRALEWVAGAWVAAASVVFVAAVAAMRRNRAGPWAPYLFAVVYGVNVVALIQLAGPGIPAALTWIPLAALLAGFCFDERVGAAVLAVGIGGLIASDLLGWTPGPSDAPAFLDEAFRSLAAHVAVVLAIVNLAFCALVLAAHRVMEQRLQRSHALIRRYVPAQLADRILAGKHDTATRHERRKLTIFFSDVVGFTGLSDELDAEELASLLNEYLGEMTALADRYGATVNQLVGDGIMIFFGAPSATDDRDHALRAVRMAQAMQQRMGELRRQWFNRGMQRPFRIRIGINTGFASVGDFGSPGRMMYSAIGQQTNLAARIQAHCEPDRILLSHSTWALVRDEVPCAPRGEIQVKGLHYPVLVYEVADSVVRNAA